MDDFLGDIHQQCDISATDFGRESGYGTAESGASDTGSPINDLPEEPFISRKPKPEEEEVKKYAQMIYEVIYNHSAVPNNTADGDIIRAGKELHDMIEADLKDKMQTFIEKIKHDSTNLSPNMKQLYLKESFVQLMRKVAPKASWRSYGHVLLCLGLIRKVAEDYQIELNPQFQSDIKGVYSDFVVNHFTEFIASMGGFTDISDYLSHVKYYNESSFLGLGTAVLGVAAAGLVWLTRG